MTNIDQNRLVDVRYHAKSCYSTYKRKVERHEVETTKRKPQEPDLWSLTSLVTRPMRSKAITSPDPRDKPCVICNHVKCQGDTKSFKIESSEVADRLWKAANFNNDEIHIRPTFLKQTGDLLAKDVSYHNNCMIKYISKLPCHELIKMGKFGERGKIPETFLPSNEIDLSWKKNEFTKQYRLWILAWYKNKSPVGNGPHISSFAAVKSLLDPSTHFITKCAFTPILPYLATEYCDIHNQALRKT